MIFNISSWPAKDSQLQDLSVILMGSGTIEIHRSIQASLIDLGCEVFWTQTNQLKQETFDHKIDLVFHLELMSKGSAHIDELRRNLNKQNPDAVIIDIPLAHPIISTISLGLKSINAINSFLKERRIVQWSICSVTLNEWHQYGLANSFFAPLGINDYYLLRKDRIELIEGWYTKNSEYHKIMSDSKITDPTIDFAKDLVKEKIVYAGLPSSPWEKLITVHSPSDVEFLTMNFLSKSKEVFRSISNFKIEPDNYSGFIDYHFAWSLRVPLERRRKMLQLISKNFKNHVSVWGDGWSEYISNSYATSLAPRYFYNQALCCLDFGSLQFDTPLFPRTCEIIKSGGLLISSLSDEEILLVKENQFRTSDEMLTIIEDAFNPVLREEKLEKQKLLFSKFNFNKIMLTIVKKVYEIV